MLQQRSQAIERGRPPRSPPRSPCMAVVFLMVALLTVRAAKVLRACFRGAATTGRAATGATAAVQAIVQGCDRGTTGAQAARD